MAEKATKIAIKFMEQAVKQNWRWYVLERDCVYAAMMKPERRVEPVTQESGPE